MRAKVIKPRITNKHTIAPGAYTHIKKGCGGVWQAAFTIGVQTFFLQGHEDEDDWTSRQSAEWFQKNLDIALLKLTQK